METLPQHQNFGLAEGYTEVIVADTFETILGKTLQEINDSDEAADSSNVISIAVFAPINSDKKTTERLQRTADWFLSELAAAKNNFIRKHRPKLFCICNRQRKKAFSVVVVGM